MQKQSKQHLDWPTYLNLIDKLYEKIDWKKEKFNVIISINRGGNIIGTLLSHKTGIPLKVLHKEGMIYETEKFLVIDEIADSGSTLANVNYLSQGRNKKYHPLQYANKDFKTATLHCKKGSKVTPDYFVETTDKWIVYPYETI